jgi:hypothetical protein
MMVLWAWGRHGVEEGVYGVDDVAGSRSGKMVARTEGSNEFRDGSAGGSEEVYDGVGSGEIFGQKVW